MKKFLIILTISLLIGCSNNHRESESLEIAKEVQELIIQDTSYTKDALTLTNINIEVLSDFYIQAYLSIKNIDIENESLSDRQKEVLNAFDLYFYQLLSKIDLDNENIDLAFVGIDSEASGFEGVYILKFQSPLEIDSKLVETINKDYDNGLEYIFVYQDYLVIIQDGFIGDMPKFMNDISLLFKQK